MPSVKGVPKRDSSIKYITLALEYVGWNNYVQFLDEISSTNTVTEGINALRKKIIFAATNSQPLCNDQNRTSPGKPYHWFKR